RAGGAGVARASRRRLRRRHRVLAARDRGRARGDVLDRVPDAIGIANGAEGDRLDAARVAGASAVTAYRAHGKGILLGEHAVGDGHRALAGALADGVVVEAEDGRGLLRIPQWELVIDPAEATEAPLARAYGGIRRRAGEPARDLTLTFNLPTGAGLGSSAAMA